MYKKVLVPLDGSKMAETVLTDVKELLKVGAVGEIVLLTVAEEIRLHVMDVSSAWIAESVDMKRLRDGHVKNAEAYMTDIQSRLRAEGLQTSGVVLEGNVSQTIVRYAQENQCDLIVIAAHSNAGIKEWVFGSVALRVLHDARTPVLLIRPEKAAS